MIRFIRSLEIGDHAFGWVVLVAFIGFLVHKPAREIYDDWSTAQPWFKASFSVSQAEDGSEVVFYDRRINRIVHGVWSVNLFSLDPKLDLVCNGGGYATYRPVTSGVIELTLDEFVGTDCEVTPGSYEMCAFYSLKDRRDVGRHFGPYCYRFDR